MKTTEQKLNSRVGRDVLIAIALCGLFWMVLWSLKPNFAKPQVDLALSIENEEKLGEMIEESMQSKDPAMKPLNNAYADSCVKVISERLLAELDSSEYNYNIKVIESDEVNAFAIPGGKIFVCEGLLKFASSAEEVAAVLAHEMGHVEERHVINGMMVKMGITGLIAVITDGNAGALENLTSEIMSSYFDREQETEADMFGLKLLESAYIHPSHMSKVFLKMDEKFGHLEGPGFLSTHPALEDRVHYTGDYLLAAGFKEIPFDLDWSGFSQ